MLNYKELKVHFRDKKQKNSQVLYMNVKQSWNNQFRFDLYSKIIGVLASAVVTPKDLEIALYRDRKFYKGSMDESVLKKMFKISFSYKSLETIFTATKSKKLNWNCHLSSTGLLKSCKNKSLQLVKWFYKKGVLKKIHLQDSSKKEISFYVLKQSQIKGELKKIKIPASFSKIETLRQ